MAGEINQNNMNTNSPNPNSVPSGNNTNIGKQGPVIKPEHHYELNAFGWVIVIVVAVALLWFFVLGGSFDFNFGGEKGISQEILAKRMTIANGDLGETPLTNVVEAFSLQYLPLPENESDIRIITVQVSDSEEFNIGNLSYLSSERIANLENAYVSWAENKGYDISERNSSVNGEIVLDVIDGEDSVVTVTISPSGRNNSKISLDFPLEENL